MVFGDRVGGLNFAKKAIENEPVKNRRVENKGLSSKNTEKTLSGAVASGMVFSDGDVRGLFERGICEDGGCWAWDWSFDNSNGYYFPRGVRVVKDTVRA